MGMFDAIQQAVATAQKQTAEVGREAGFKPAVLQDVDVEKQLAAMEGSEKYNWRVSIADLMTMIGLDGSYAARKELAHELGMTGYSGTAEENIKLHKTVMNELAKNGGQVPDSLK